MFYIYNVTKYKLQVHQTAYSKKRVRGVPVREFSQFSEEPAVFRACEGGGRAEVLTFAAPALGAQTPASTLSSFSWPLSYRHVGIPLEKH